MSDAHRTAAATAARVVHAAHRAAEDPDRLARAVRIVRAALATGKVAGDDLTPLPLGGAR